MTTKSSRTQYPRSGSRTPLRIPCLLYEPSPPFPSLFQQRRCKLPHPDEYPDFRLLRSLRFLILFLLGFFVPFACLLFLTLYLVLFPAFVTHYGFPFRGLFVLSVNVKLRLPGSYYPILHGIYPVHFPNLYNKLWTFSDTCPTFSIPLFLAHSLTPDPFFHSF